MAPKMNPREVKIVALFVLVVPAFWFVMLKQARVTCPAPPTCPLLAAEPAPPCPVCETATQAAAAVCKTATQAAAASVCFPKVTEPPVERRGQIDENTGFGRALAEIASYDHVSLVLEIGTWFGGGSSHVIASALDRPGNCVSRPGPGPGPEQCCSRALMTLELFEPAWRHARAFLQDLPAWCLLGTTVSVGDMLSPGEIPDEDKGEHYRLYYERDRALLASQAPQLQKLCKEYSPDLVLIDGNEYTGFGEYRIVSAVCKPRYLALHDTGTLKTRKIEEELQDSAAPYRVLRRGADKGATWAVYERAGLQAASLFERT